MKALITASGQFGPFKSIVKGEDRWVCDGAEYQFSVIGDATVVEWVAPPPPMPTQAEYIKAAEAHYDAVAQAKHYDDRYTCALRAGYSGPFQAEGQAFATWMDNCNALGYQVMGEVLAGTRPQPTIDEFLALLPAAPWSV